MDTMKPAGPDPVLHGTRGEPERCELLKREHEMAPGGRIGELGI